MLKKKKKLIFLDKNYFDQYPYNPESKEPSLTQIGRRGTKRTVLKGINLIHLVRYTKMSPQEILLEISLGDLQEDCSSADKSVHCLPWAAVIGYLKSQEPILFSIWYCITYNTQLCCVCKLLQETTHIPLYKEYIYPLPLYSFSNTGGQLCLPWVESRCLVCSNVKGAHPKNILLNFSPVSHLGRNN